MDPHNLSSPKASNTSSFSFLHSIGSYLGRFSLGRVKTADGPCNLTESAAYNGDWGAAMTDQVGYLETGNGPAPVINRSLPGGYSRGPQDNIEIKDIWNSAESGNGSKDLSNFELSSTRGRITYGSGLIIMTREEKIWHEQLEFYLSKRQEYLENASYLKKYIAIINKVVVAWDENKFTLLKNMENEHPKDVIFIVKVEPTTAS